MKKLVLAANKDYAYMLGSATRKQHSAALLTSLGWSVFSEIPRFHKLLFPGTAAKQLARSRPLRAAADIAFAPFRPRAKKIAKIGGQVRAVGSIDDSFDELWSESRLQWGCSISRSSKYLNWQFTKQPGKRFDVLGYYENDKLLGYAVMFFRRASDAGVVDKAAISDICYHPDHAKETVDALLAAALQLAIERRAGGLVTDAIDTLLQERLRHFGFWPVKSGLELMAIGPEPHELLYDARHWYLTRGDSDISIFELPNL